MSKSPTDLTDITALVRYAEQVHRNNAAAAVAPSASSAAAQSRAEPDARRAMVNLDELLRCAICIAVVRPPLRQCFAQHFFCAECVAQYNAAAAPAGRGICPTCRGPMQADEAPCLLAKALLEWVPAACPHSGCPRNDIPRSQLAHHIDTCAHRVVACRNETHGCLWRGPVRARADHELLCLWRFSAEFMERVQKHLRPLEERLNSLNARLRELALKRSATAALLTSESDRAAHISSTTLVEWSEEQSFDLHVRSRTELFAWGFAWWFGVEPLCPPVPPYFGAYLRCDTLSVPYDGFVAVCIAGDRAVTLLQHSGGRMVTRLQLPASARLLFQSPAQFAQFLEQRTPAQTVSVVLARLRKPQPATSEPVTALSAVANVNNSKPPRRKKQKPHKV